MTNLVLIFVDDMAWGDPGCYGATDWKTPHLDSLARDGVRFTDFYVAQPVCSASRASLLTGCYANRVGIGGALGPDSALGLSPKETTISSQLKASGYETACFGKWHLGHRPEFLPTRHGFDRFFGIPYSHDMWPRHPENPKAYPPLPLYDGERAIRNDLQPADIDRLTGEYTSRAVDFIRKSTSPFFLYLAHSLPHVPLGASPKFRERAATIGLYGAVIEEIDSSVGAVLDALRRKGIERETLVIFASDNGPWLSYGDHAGRAGGLREGKGTVFEGGVRVPLLARWPGQIRAGATVSEPAMTIDLLPTIAKIVGAPAPERRIDGRDIGDLLRGKPGARSPQDAYFFYYTANELQALRAGRYKLILPHTFRTLWNRPAGRGGIPAKYRDAKLSRPMLFDLVDDFGETRDLADQRPEIVRSLLARAEAMRADLGDKNRPGPGARGR